MGKLALGRRPGESILIGPPGRPVGTITVARIESNGTVVLSLDFPEVVEINRAEVAEQKAKRDRKRGQSD